MANAVVSRWFDFKGEDALKRAEEDLGDLIMAYKLRSLYIQAAEELGYTEFDTFPAKFEVKLILHIPDEDKGQVKLDMGV